jgi:hypothetical protein
MMKYTKFLTAFFAVYQAYSRSTYVINVISAIYKVYSISE